jgi:hypothetical protein
MASRDFMPFRTLDGSQEQRVSRGVTSSETFLVGEPIAQQSGGRAAIATTDPSTVVGIAAHRSTDVNGTSLAGDTQITLYGVGRNQLYKTRNFSTSGTGTSATPAVTRIGDFAGLILNGSDWYVDTGANNKICEIVGLRDRNGRDISDPSHVVETIVFTIFRFIL